MTAKLYKLRWFILFLVIFIPTMVVLADEPETDNDRFEVSCSEVEGDILLDSASSSKCSVQMAITNKGDDFDGIVKILYFDGVNTSDVNALGETYKIQSGQTKIIYFTIPNIISGNEPYPIPLRVDFLDEDGKTLCKKMTEFQVTSDIGYTVAAGVYTDDTNKLKVIDQSGFKYETTLTGGNITMKSKQYSDELMENIEQLNVNLLIVDKDVSEKLWENVSKWVLSGGHLMMARSVYQQLIDKTLDEQNVTDWGTGRIFVYDQTEWNKTWFQTSVKDLFGSEGISLLINGSYTDYYWNVNGALNYDMSSKLPPLTRYFIILLLYIFCMGPLVYLFLKKKDKREYMWLVIPCMAILFSIIVYKAGSDSRYTEPFVRFYSTVDLTDEATIENTKILLTSPGKGRAVMRVDGESDLHRITDSYYTEYEDDKNEKLSYMRQKLGEAEYDVALSVSDTGTDVLTKSSKAFDANYFSNSRILKTAGTIEADLFYYRGGLSGTVTNTTKCDLHQVFVLHKGLLFQIGDLAAGETKTVNDLNKVQILKSQNVVTDGWQLSNEGNTVAASAIMNTLINNLTLSVSGQQDLVGGFTLDYDIGVQKNSQIASVEGMTMVKRKIKVTDNGDGWSSQAFIGPETPDNEEDLYTYDSDSYLIYGASVINTRYIVSEMSESLTLTWLNQDPEIEFSFYNLTTGVYDTVMKESNTMQSDELKQYIAKDGTIKVRIQVGESENDHFMPILTVSGGEKND